MRVSIQVLNGSPPNGQSKSSAASTILTNIATIVTIATPVVTILVLIATGSTNVPATILAIYVCFLVTFLIWLLLRQERRHHRDAHYGPAMVPVWRAFTSLADASWTMVQNDGSEELFLQYLRASLRNLAQAFSLITDRECRMSIKMVYAAAGEPEDRYEVRVRTLCRSNEGGEPQPASPDRIGGNTDFEKIFVDKMDFFFSNDLLKERDNGYKNSHWDDKTFRDHSFEYLSTIVWAIGRVHPSEGENPSKREVIGFLCVDTQATNVFNRTYDVPLGSAFAQGLYLALQRYRMKQAAVTNKSVGGSNPGGATTS